MKKKNKCPRCKFRDSKNQAANVHGVGFFDVETAERILRLKPRRPKRMTRKDLAKFTRGIKLEHPDHVYHANIQRIGIVGQTPTIEFLLDGTHRALRCRKENRPFMYYLLNEFETGQCFMGKRIRVK